MAISKSFYINFFLVLSISVLTYTYNIYILYALLYCILVILTKRQGVNFLLLALFCFLSIVYTVYAGYGSGYRCLKTLLVFLPVMVAVKCEKVTVTKIMYYFIFLSAALVYIDFILHYTLGLTITHAKFSGSFIRLGGLTEDSNFFSYVTLSFVQYLYIKHKKYNLFLVGSIFLSFSVSAIVFFFVLFFLNIVKFNKYKLLLFVTIGIFYVYYQLIFLADELRLLAMAFDGDIRHKLISLTMRFEGQKEAFDILRESGNYLLGMGAQSTQELTTRGANLHNSYLQIFLEMGLLLFLPTISFIIYFVKKINNEFLSLMCVILLMGNILEVVYFPLISLVFFFSKSYENEKQINTNKLVVNVK